MSRNHELEDTDDVRRSDYLNPSTESGYLDTSTSESGYLQPLTSDSGHVQPSTSESGYVQPSTSESGYLQLSTAESDYVQPLTSESGYVQASTSESGYVQPSNSESGYVQPSNSESGYVQPSNSESGYVQPSNSESGYLHPSPSGRCENSSESVTKNVHLQHQPNCELSRNETGVQHEEHVYMELDQPPPYSSISESFGSSRLPPIQGPSDKLSMTQNSGSPVISPPYSPTVSDNPGYTYLQHDFPTNSSNTVSTQASQNNVNGQNLVYVVNNTTYNTGGCCSCLLVSAVLATLFGIIALPLGIVAIVLAVVAERRERAGSETARNLKIIGWTMVLTTLGTAAGLYYSVRYF